MKTFGVAIVGTGFIGPVHIEALRRLGQNVLGVLGSTRAKGEAAAIALQLPRAYANYDQLLADPAVEVVHLTSPNRFHFEQCKRAIAAGKHVVCEKPLAMNTRETAELVALADRASVVTAVNYNVRYYPLCLQARQMRLAGQLGRIHHVTGSYLQDWLLYDTDFNWRVLAEDGGELRAVADIGTHWLDLISFITGLEVESVCADLATIHPIRKSIQGSVETFQAVDTTRPYREIPITTDDYGSILLRFRGGSRGALTVSQVAAGRKNCIRFDIAAAQAGLSWDSEEPNSLQIGHRTQANQTLLRDPSLLAPEVRPFANYPGGHAEGFPDSFKQLFRCVYQAIETGDRTIPFPTFADGHREVQLCEAILNSHREGRWCSLDAKE